MRRAPIVIASLLLLTAAKPSPHVGDFQFSTEYEVTYLTFEVGKAFMKSRLSGDDLAVDGTIASAGLAKLFDRTTGSVSLTAKIKPDGLQPQHFKLDYKYGKKAQLTEILFSEGDVRETVKDPLPRKPGKNLVPVQDDDLLSVLDPLTSAIIKASSIEEVCRRTIRAYSGWMRADLVMNPVSYGKTDMSGLGGSTATCSVKYKPISGYRKNNKALISVRDKARMEVTFAQIEKTGLYVPVHAKARTEYGTVTIRARRSKLTN